MSEPSSVPALRLFGDRAFSFYPAIRNVEYNEWTYLRETWSEVLVVNSKTRQEIWIPRHFVGRISSADEPVLIVGLTREVELKGGAVWPFERQLIEMPTPPHPGTRVREPEPSGSPPPEVGPSQDTRMGRMILYVLSVGLVGCLLVVIFAFQGAPRPQDWFSKGGPATKDQQYLSLNREDAYHDVVRKLGAPEREEWLSPESAEMHFEALWYSDRGYLVVLMGAERKGARYIGAIHAASRTPLDSVPLPGGGRTTAMLRNLPKF